MPVFTFSSCPLSTDSRDGRHLDCGASMSIWTTASSWIPIVPNSPGLSLTGKSEILSIVLGFISIPIFRGRFHAITTGKQISSRLLSARSANVLLELPQVSYIYVASVPSSSRCAYVERRCARHRDRRFGADN